MVQSSPPPPSSPGESVAAEVRASIARANVHQTQVADLAGISRTTFRRRLAGASAFTVDELIATADALRVPVEHFFADAPTPAS